MAVIIAAHDLSGVGRCSLTTALAVIPALGHTCYPLPTAVLSQQTAFEGYSFLDFTGLMSGYLDGWRKLNIEADIIYTGFLGNGAQAALLADFVAGHPDALVVVDPVMGDGGGIYPCFDNSFVKDMKQLASSAHILIPNATEFNLLSGQDPSRPLPDAAGLLNAAFDIGARLKYVIITSAFFDGKTCNLLIDIDARNVLPVPFYGNGISYSGSGDLFASMICGLTASGAAMENAVKTAGRFISEVIAAMPPTADPRYGLPYEPFLGKLVR